MKRFALLGDPIEGSSSPWIHQAGFAAAGLQADYSLWPTTRHQLGGRLEQALEGLDGFNLTLPLKQEILPYLTAMSARARNLASVNSVRVEGRELHGHNTDFVGLQASLRALAAPVGPALVLGAGGVVGAVLCALEEAGFGPLFVCARRPEQAQAWAQTLNLNLQIESWAVRHRRAEQVHLVVQATPLGTSGTDPLPLDLARLKRGVAVLDLVVRRRGASPLVHQAGAHGLRCLDGRLMLVEQAIAAQEHWGLGSDGAQAMRSCWPVE